MRFFTTAFCTVCTFLMIMTDACCASYNYIQQKCRQISAQNPPKISIIYNCGNLQYNTDLDQKQLAELNYKITGERKENLNGLTSLEPTITVDGVVFKHERLDENRVCLYPEELKIKVKFNPIIYILSSIPKDSCQYNLTLRHEQTHIDIGYTALDLLLKALSNKLPDIAWSTTVRVVNVSADKNVLEEINSTYQQQVLTIWDIFKNALDEQHKRLDTQENYIRESKMCQ